jgi:hypothetical protein
MGRVPIIAGKRRDGRNPVIDPAEKTRFWEHLMAGAS